MGKPEKKLKKIILIMGVTGAVYGSLRFLLPLVIPFLLAWGLAVCLRPSSQWIARHACITVKGRKFGIPTGLAGVLQLAAILTILLAVLYFGGRKLCAETRLLVSHIPQWTKYFDQQLTAFCHFLEEGLNLHPQVLVKLMQEMLRGVGISVKNTAMPYLMGNSVTVFRWGMGVVILTIISFVATGLSIQEMERWKERCQNSLFAEEYRLLGHRLKIVGNAFFRTQGIIMFLTSLICTVVFWLLGNPYYILAGVGVGLLDALPIFGTGTVLIPWALICMVSRKWKEAVILVVLYVICYGLREILEAKLMGDKVGMSPLETLISMYVGLQLFGIPGFLLGPVGFLLIRDLVEFWEEKG